MTKYAILSQISDLIHDAVDLGGLSPVELHGRLSVGGGVLGPIALLALLFRARLADRERVEKVLFVQELQLLDLQFGALPGLELRFVLLVVAELVVVAPSLLVRIPAVKVFLFLSP